MLVLVLRSVPAIALDGDRDYESALRALNAQQPDYQVATIHLKNSIQKSPEFLPSKVLLGDVYFQQAMLPEAIDIYSEALFSGADINHFLDQLAESHLALGQHTELRRLAQYVDSMTPPNRLLWQLFRARSFAQTEQPEQAREQFVAALSAQPGHVLAQATYAQFLASQGEQQQALELIDSALSTEPNNPRLHLVRANIYIKDGALETALREMQRAEQLAPSDPFVLRSVAMVLMASQRYDQAQQYVARLLRVSPNEPAILLMQAWLNLRANEPEQAIELLQPLSNALSLIQQRDLMTDRNLLYLKGTTAFIQGKYELAKSSLQRYLDTQPDDLSAIQMVAKSVTLTESSRMATAFLEEYKNQVATDLDLSLLLMNFYLKKQDDFKARDLLMRVKRHFDDDPMVFFLQAIVAKSQGRYTQAMSALKRVEREDQVPRSVVLLKTELLITQGQFEPAGALVQQLLRDAPNDIRVNNLAAAYYLKTADFEQASEYLNKVLAHDPNNRQGLYNQAFLALSTGSLATARSLLTKLLERYPQNLSALLLRAQLAERLGEQQDAMNWLQNVIEISPNHTQALTMKRKLLVDQGQWRAALELNTLLLTQAPLNSEYLVTQIRLLQYVQDFEQAKVVANRLRGVWATDDERQYQLALIFFDIKQPAEGFAILHRLQQKYPDNHDIVITLIDAYLQRGQTEQARDLLDSANQLAGSTSANDEDGRSWALLNGKLLVSEQRFSEAAEWFDNHIRLNSQLSVEQPEFWVYLYEMAMRGERTQRSIELLKQAVARYPQTFWLQRLLADLLLHTQDYQPAEVIYRSLLEQPSVAEDASLLNNLANVILRSKATAPALKEAEYLVGRAIKLDPKNAAILDTYGWVLGKQNNFHAALAQLRQAHSFSGQDPSILYHLAYVLHRLDRNDEARIYLVQAMNTNQPFFELPQAEALLRRLQNKEGKEGKEGQESKIMAI